MFLKWNWPVCHYMSTKLFFWFAGIPNFDWHLHVLNLFKVIFSFYHGKSLLNHHWGEYCLELLPGTQNANPRWSIGILRWCWTVLISRKGGQRLWRTFGGSGPKRVPSMECLASLKAGDGSGWKTLEVLRVLAQNPRFCRGNEWFGAREWCI